MNVRIGIADAGRDVELELENPSEIESQITEAFESDLKVMWVTDVKARRVGIPVERIAYVEITESRSSVGFG